MSKPRIPLNEEQRISALYSLKILDTPPEERFDRITRLAQRVFNVPIALVTFVDTNRQWFKSCQGLSFRQTPRDVSFCAHAIHDTSPLIISDALEDERFADNPLVVEEPHIRFYAGYPLSTPDGKSQIGTLCIIDTQPRRFDQAEITLLKDLAILVEDQLNLIGATTHQRDFEQRATAALQQSTDHFQAMIQHAVDIITILNLDGTIRYQSPAIERTLGYSPTETVGLNAFDFVHPEDKPTVIASIQSSISNPGVPIFEEYRFRHKDGSWRNLNSTGCNLLDNPAVTGLVINSRDVTEYRQAEDRAQQQDRLAAVGQLAAGIAHDFNNLLTVMMGVSQIVEMQENISDDVRESMQNIYQQGQRAAELVRQVLDFSRNTSAEHQPVQIQTFLKELLKLLDRTFPDNIEITSDFPEGEMLVEANLTQLQQVVTNLAVNARDAMTQGGELSFGLLRRQVLSGEKNLPEIPPGIWVELTVSDTGTGMTPDVLKRIYEPFFTTKAPDKGTGLGLSQVYGIVKQHNGEITVTSEVGVGTTFRVYLPELARASAEVVRPAGSFRHGQGQTVLIAEDDPSVLRAAKVMLEHLDYVVITAQDGQEAGEVFEKQAAQIDVIITDLVMPTAGGIDLIRKVRAMNPNLPVVVMTGYPVEELPPSQILEGITGYLQKPLSLEVLSNVVSKALGLPGGDL